MVLCVLGLRAKLQAQQSFTTNATVYYGVKNKIKFDFVMVEKLVYGAGFAEYIDKGAIGKDYSELLVQPLT